MSAPPSARSAGRERLRSRVLTIGSLVLFLGLTLGLVSIPLLAREEMPVVSAADTLSLRVDLGGGRAIGQMQVATDLRFSVTFQLRDVREEDRTDWPVSLVLLMPEHAMSPLLPQLSRIAGGRFSASGILPMPGRWELWLVTPDAKAKVPFRVAA